MTHFMEFPTIVGKQQELGVPYEANKL